MDAASNRRRRGRGAQEQTGAGAADSGNLLTYIIVDGLSFPIGWMDAFFRVATDQSHQWVFMVCGLFGALIALLGASHGTLGFSRLLGRLCRAPEPR